MAQRVKFLWKICYQNRSPSQLKLCKWTYLYAFSSLYVMDYVASHAESNTCYLTHIDPSARYNPRPQRVQLIAKEARRERTLNDLAFADDRALLENTNFKSQQQLDSMKSRAGSVGLEINTDKTVQLQLYNQDYYSETSKKRMRIRYSGRLRLPGVVYYVHQQRRETQDLACLGRLLSP